METRLKEDEMEKIKRRCGFSCGISVDCAGSGRERAGGISLLWSDQKQVDARSMHGIQIARQAPKISHLFFADDSLLFARANIAEAEVILNVLAEYQIASGQMVNLDKSEVSFSQNVRIEDKDLIRNRMGVKTVDTHSKYLGLPVVFGR
jgi:hypothetical protein